MTVSFDSIPFSVVISTDMLLPMPEPDPQTGIETYQATIQIADYTDYTRFRARFSRVTILPALGGGGLVVIEPGTVPLTLIYPRGGAEATVTAILTDFRPKARAFYAGYRQADVTFTIVSTP